MIRILFCTAALLAGLMQWTPLHPAAIAVPGHVVQSRPEKVDPKPKSIRTIVNLKCEWLDTSTGVGLPNPLRFRAVVTNNTGNIIPAGTTIHWSVNRAIKGEIPLQQALPVGSKKASDPRHGPTPGQADPKAWYYK